LKAAHWTIGLVMASLLISGCATYRTVSLPEVSSSAESGVADADLALASVFRVSTRSGAVFRGKLLRVSADEIVIEKDGFVGMEEWPIARSDILRIERVNTETFHSIVLVAAIGTVIYFISKYASSVRIVATGDWPD